MSEKHLTELPWKTLTTKQGIKDLGVGKALAAYAAADAAAQPAQALEALRQIPELAIKLKKANANKADLIAYLDDVVKEVKKTLPALEAKAKSASAAAPGSAGAKAATPPAAPPTAPAAGQAKTPPAAPAKQEEDDDEEKQAAAFKKDLKQQMISALAQVKSRAPGDPEQQKEPKPQLQFMACLAGKGCSVLVSRKVGSATKKLLIEIAGSSGGEKFLQGECIFEKNKHTFVLEAVAGGLAKKLSTALHTETGQTYKVRVRNTDGSQELDSDTDQEVAEAPAAGAKTTAPGASDAGKLVATFKARLPAVAERYKTVIKAGPANRAILESTMNSVVASAKSQSFGQALSQLDTLEVELGKAAGPAGATASTAAGATAAAADAAGATAPVAQPESPAARWETVRARIRAKLQDEIKEILATKDPDAGSAELELKAVLAQISGEMQTQRQADVMLNYLQDDEVVANVSDLAFDLKTPLVNVLNEIRPQLTPA